MSAYGQDPGARGANSNPNNPYDFNGVQVSLPLNLQKPKESQDRFLA
jgi:hypothetical protein